MTCPRCDSELIAEVDGYKLLGASCTNEDCSLYDGELTDAEYAKLSEDMIGEAIDNAMDRDD